MNRRYWDALAGCYEAEVQDTLRSDRGGVIESCLDRFASRHVVAADFGCGIGHYVGALASRFGAVQALDHSDDCLAQALQRYGELENVIFRQADLTQPSSISNLERAGLGVCMNVLIAPDLDLRRAILRTVHAHLLPGAHLLAVVPALESVLLTDQRLIEWHVRDGMPRRRAERAALADEPGFIGNPAAGIVDCGGEPTKHYLREEAAAFLAAAQFDVREIHKVEFGWDEEFNHPPPWLGAPFPWVWLLVGRRPR